MDLEKIDHNNLPDLKIKVDNPEDSKRAQDCFFIMGGKWINGKSHQFTNAPFLFLYMGKAMGFSYTGEYSEFKEHEATEITLPELKALVKKHFL